MEGAVSRSPVSAVEEGGRFVLEVEGLVLGLGFSGGGEASWGVGGFGGGEWERAVSW